MVNALARRRSRQLRFVFLSTESNYTELKRIAHDQDQLVYMRRGGATVVEMIAGLAEEGWIFSRRVNNSCGRLGLADLVYGRLRVADLVAHKNMWPTCFGRFSLWPTSCGRDG
jgi:hypothetical protein